MSGPTLATPWESVYASKVPFPPGPTRKKRARRLARPFPITPDNRSGVRLGYLRHHLIQIE
jgi:hypothetical protein